MFYSHQLLARKAPLGQIWMAATMHAKINRRKLDKLNLINICEEILYPSVPMALRLSGILMGGVVIVYERKVKLLYEDVTRLLVEINEAWKIKTVPDPTVLPKGKSQAKYEAVTLPEQVMMDTAEIEQSMHFSGTSTTTMRFHDAAGYITMRLDRIDEPFTNDENARGQDDLSQPHHQADRDNITLLDPFDSHQADPSLFNRFERFDIEGDEDGQTNFTPHQEHSQVPTLIPSPPQENPQQGNEMGDDQIPEPHNDRQSDEFKDKAPPVQEHEKKQGLGKRKTRGRPGRAFMDYEQTIIPGQVYQTWLQNSSNIVSKRGRNKHVKPTSTMKTVHLMELPPVALISGLSGNGTRQIHYPPPLLELWMRSTRIQSPHDSPSARTSAPQPPEPVSSSAQDRVFEDPLKFPVEDFHSGVGSHPKQVSIEKQMPNLDNFEFPVNEANQMFTPANSGDNARSIPSSASGNGDFLPLDPEAQLPSGRSNRKRPYSSSRHSGSSLPPLAEEHPWEFPEPDFKLRRLSGNDISHEHETLVETGPTPTQHPLVDHPIDKITEEIRKHLKTHFETPGAPQIESLDQLAYGMNRMKAAQLFYQTCVLASHDLVRVEQTEAFADILISKGSKM